MKNELSQKGKWIEISLELEENLQEPLANFLLEIGAEGVITDETIINPLTGKSRSDSTGHKLVKAYLKQNSQSQDKIQSLDRYLKSLSLMHPADTISQLKLRVILEEDWTSKWQKFFTSSRIGKHIIVKPSWELFLPREGDIVIEMDPGMAFGTGTHATTRMCLEIIEDLACNQVQSIQSMLDVGIGSGILSIAAAKLGVPTIVGIDIDPIALSYAQKNVEKNGVTDQVAVYETSLKKLEGTFDLIAANILSDILIKLRKDLCNHLADNGTLILSGIVAENEEKVKKKFVSKKLIPLASYNHADWICMVLKKEVA